MRWCARCVLPDSRPNLVIGDDGTCNACRNHGLKHEIDWTARKSEFLSVVKSARQRSRPDGWDCIIPVSGGKDSTWQTLMCLEHGLKPLAVTWKTPARTEIGQQNLDNLVRLGVDHIDWQINPKVESHLMLEAFGRFGSTAIPMHMAIFAIPLTLAVRFRVPLIVWGENSAFEYGSPDNANTGFALDAEWLRRFGVTHGTTAKDWVSDDISAKDLASYFGPSEAELEAAGVKAVFLGYYFPWDPEETSRVAAEHGFRIGDRVRTGAWDYADIDDDFISLHHWMKWMKFGFGRAFDNLSVDIRNGRLTRAQAIEKLKAIGDDTPHQDIDRFCQFSGINRTQFLTMAEAWRNYDLWKQRPGGDWYIPDFLIPDWPWPKQDR